MEKLRTATEEASRSMRRQERSKTGAWPVSEVRPNRASAWEKMKEATSV